MVMNGLSICDLISFQPIPFTHFHFIHFEIKALFIIKRLFFIIHISLVIVPYLLFIIQSFKLIQNVGNEESRRYATSRTTSELYECRMVCDWRYNRTE